MFLDRGVDDCSGATALGGVVLGLIGAFLFELGFGAVFPEGLFDGDNDAGDFTFSAGATFFCGVFSSLATAGVFSVAEVSNFSGAKIVNC